jgi:hypothetical protein
MEESGQVSKSLIGLRVCVVTFSLN